MSSGGGGVKSKPKANTTTTTKAKEAKKAADTVAAKLETKMRNEVGGTGSSILTTGAGILDDTDIHRNLLGANAYRMGNSTLG